MRNFTTIILFIFLSINSWAQNSNQRDSTELNDGAIEKVTEFLKFGYSASTSKPIGLSFYIYRHKIWQKKIDAGIGLKYRQDDFFNKDLSLSLNKANIFISENGNLSDILGYHLRLIEPERSMERLILHNLKYNIGIKSFNIGLGLGFADNGNDYYGGFISISRTILKWNLTPFGDLGFYDNDYRYEIGLIKFINLEILGNKGIWIELAHEKIFDIEQMKFSVEIEM